MKKAFYSLLALVFINLSASATYTESTSNGYNSPISDTSLSFESSVSGESVKTSWDTFTKDTNNTATTANSSNLNNSTKEKLDTLFETFITKLENKYNENSKRIGVLETIIKELEKLGKKNIKMKAMVNYLIEKINLQMEKYQDDFDNLESIFQNIID